jgi:hypothetical protein
VRPAAARTLAGPEDSLMEELAAICAQYGIEAVIV